MGYEITILSDTAYEELVAEILFKNGELVVVSQERSTSRFEVSFYSRYRDSGDTSIGPLTIDLEEFCIALTEASDIATLKQ